MAASDDTGQETAKDRIQQSGNVSQSECLATSQGGSTTRQMLQIKLDKLPLLESLREKVEKNYSVEIRKDVRSASDGKSVSDVQWISVSGSKGDIKDAGTYISALCNPTEIYVYDHASTLSGIFDEDTCHKIEDKSRAVLMRDGDCRLIIQGSDQLHVLLALSIVEDIVARFETNISESSPHNSSAMLDSVLKRAYSNDGEAEDGLDWSTMPEEVKQAVLVSLLDNDVPETTVVDVENVTDERLDNAETVPTDVIAGASSPVSSSNEAATVNVSDTSTADSIIDLTRELDYSHPVIQPLVKLALSKGYSGEEIENVLSNSRQWKESEFLRTLHTNRRRQSAMSQQPSVSVSETSQQPVVSSDSSVPAQSRFADRSTHSLACSVTGSKDTDRAVTCSMEVANVQDIEMRDTCVDVDEMSTEISVAAADDSVILLKSDHEMDSFDDNDEGDDSDNVEVEKEKEHLRLVSLTEETMVVAVPVEQALKNNAAKPVAMSRSKKKRMKKQARKKLVPDKTVHQEEKAPDVIKTGYEVNDLDCISLIPSALPATVDVSSDVVVVDDESDSDVAEVPEQADSMKLVVGKKEWRQLARQKDTRSRSPLIPLIPSGSTSGNTHVNETHNTSEPQDYPAPVCSSVPATAAAGCQKSPAQTVSGPDSLRYIVIDGSNVAMNHGNSKVFSCRGIRLVIDFFKQRGHSKVVALVPQWRRQAPTFDRPVSDHYLLEILKDQGTLTFTPSRRIGNRNISCYDDRFMLDLAIHTDGVIVTNDNYRDLYAEKSQYRYVIENRLLPYSFVDDIFMIPEDPLGQYGPRLDEFLRMPSSSGTEVPRAVSSQAKPSLLGAPPRAASTQASSFSLLGAPPRPLGLRGFAHGQNEAFLQGSTRFPHPSPLMPNQQQQPAAQQWQVRQQMLPTRQQRPYTTTHQPLWPPPSRTTTAVRNVYHSDGAAPPWFANTSTATRGSRGRGAQHVGARTAGPTLGPRPTEKTREMRQQLLDVFPDNAKQVDDILKQNQHIYSVDELCLKVSEIV